MHKLDRAAVAAPACLAAYDYQSHTWDDFGGSCKREVRFALFQIQGIEGITSEDAGEYGLRCAYCEGAIWHEGHMEHFRRKNRKRLDGYPELTFEWSNLFLACESRDHCGHYKDRPTAPAYDAEDLIKPDVDDPEHYLYFHSSGEVRVKHGIDALGAKRAGETIRVFGLNRPVLIGARSNAARSYRTKLDELNEVLEDCDETEREAYILGEIEAARWVPYSTTVKHFFISGAV